MGDSAPPDAAEVPATASAVEASPVEVIAAEAKIDSNPVEAPAKPFSWLDPHPIFVIVFVGNEERPFGLQKDFLCAKSRYFRDHFYTADGKSKDGQNGAGEAKTVEHVVHLGDVSVEGFSHVQHFLYTGNLVPDLDQAMPAYDVLVGIWKLGHRLGIEGLCERTLEAMAENKRLTQSIPATHILVQVWRDTPEGSSIRQLLLSWAAEYLRSSEERAEFARSLPQELLSELVVAMSSSYGDFWSLPNAFSSNGGPAPGGGAARGGNSNNGSTNNNGKHYLESQYDGAVQDGGGEGSITYRGSSPIPKRARYFESYPLSSGGGTSVSNPATPNINSSSSAGGAARKPSRTSLPNQRVISTKKRSHVVDVDAFSPSQKLKFCSDLLTRMLSGPGFWTRLVGPFREPVDPSSEGIPDYFDKVKRPMDLGTIKANLDGGQYTSPDEFATDMRQIFANVYKYWRKGDTIWQVCERLEKTFEEKYAQMYKWLGKMDGEEMI